MITLIKTARRARMVALAAAFCALAFSPCPAEGQLEVDRLELQLRAAPGTIAGTFAVSNTTDTARTVQLSLDDWDRTLNGATEQRRFGSARGSCSPGMEVFPTVFRLAPGQSQTVEVRYTGGAQQSSCWAIVMVEAAPLPFTTTGSARVTVNLVHGVKVYVEPPSVRPMLEVTEFDVVRRVATPGRNPADTVGNDVVALVANPGVVQSRARGRVEYRTQSDSVIARVPVDEVPVLPGASRLVRTPMPALPAGKYVVLILLDYGGPDIVAGQIQLEITQ